MSDFWSEELITDYLDDRLSQPERKQVEAHLQENPHDAETLQEFQLMRKTLRNAPSYQLDQGFSQRVVQALGNSPEIADAETSPIASVKQIQAKSNRTESPLDSSARMTIGWRSVVGVVGALAATLLLAIFLLPRPSEPAADASAEEVEQQPEGDVESGKAGDDSLPGSPNSSIGNSQDSGRKGDGSQENDESAVVANDKQNADDATESGTTPKEAFKQSDMKLPERAPNTADEIAKIRNDSRSSSKESKNENRDDSIVANDVQDREMEEGDSLTDPFERFRPESITRKSSPEKNMKRGALTPGQSWNEPAPDTIGSLDDFDIVVFEAVNTEANTEAIRTLESRSWMKTDDPVAREIKGVLPKRDQVAEDLKNKTGRKRESSLTVDGSGKANQPGGLADIATAPKEPMDQLANSAGQNRAWKEELVVFEVEATADEFTKILAQIEGRQVALNSQDRQSLSERLNELQTHTSALGLDALSDDLDGGQGGGGGRAGAQLDDKKQVPRSEDDRPTIKRIASFSRSNNAARAASAAESNDLESRGFEKQLKRSEKGSGVEIPGERPSSDNQAAMEPAEEEQVQPFADSTELAQKRHESSRPKSIRPESNARKRYLLVIRMRTPTGEILPVSPRVNSGQNQ